MIPAIIRSVIAIASLAALPLTLDAQSLPARIAIYSGNGAESSTILALFRAVASFGYTPLAITTADIQYGRLTRANFDILIIPPGEDGKKCCAGRYADAAALDQLNTKNAIRAFLSSGGGVLAEEAGAFFAAQNGGTLDIYSGNYTNITNAVGKTRFTIDPASPFASGAQPGPQDVWQSSGGGYFPNPPANVTVIARDSANNPVIVSQRYGAGALILTSYVLELRGDTTSDWTIWDNWAMQNSHANSKGVWEMLGRMISWAYNGNASLPVINSVPPPAGAPVAVVAQHTADGGAWPGLLPALGRAINYAGHIPLAIRFQDISNGRLTLHHPSSNPGGFRVVAFPGGDAYGYKTGLAGAEGNIRNFVNAGGGYYGVCAGSFYAAQSIVWLNETYPYPLQLFRGQDIGPITDIAPWPQYALTPLNVSGDDAVIGNFGTVRSMYFGGGYHTIPTPAQQGATVFSGGTFPAGSANGQSHLVRFAFGNGKIALSSTHLEAQMGSNEDWMFWDNYQYKSTAAISNPDPPRRSWDVMKAIFNNWLTTP